MRVRQGDCGGAVRGEDGRKAESLDRLGDELADSILVVDDENGATSRWRPGGRGGHGTFLDQVVQNRLHTLALRGACDKYSSCPEPKRSMRCGLAPSVESTSTKQLTAQG